MNVIEAIKSGSVQDFDQIFQQYYRRVYHFLLRSVKETSDAEDLTQAVFIKLWQSRKSLRSDLSLETQVFKVARTLVIDHYRKVASQQKLLETYTLLMNQGPTGGADDQQDAKLALVHQAIDELPAKRREVFRLSRVNGMTYEEIAEELSISKNTVHVHITKALHTLRKKLAGMYVL